MSGYAIYCIKNPCSYQTEKWTAYKYDGGWQQDKPVNGTDLNSAYKLLEHLNTSHAVNKKCGCEFTVVEIGD